MKTFLPILVILGLSAATAGAMPSDTAQRLETEDKKLGEAYQKVIAQLAKKENGKDKIALLRAAERRWIAFRDAECEFRGAAVTTRPQVACSEELTLQRLKALEQLSDDLKYED